jgi:MoaA/NifB/PqqE/SkfB family radical SAM enzyme
MDARHFFHRITSKYCQFRWFDERFAHLSFKQRKPFPNYFLIQTTSSCNASCKICPYCETSKELAQGIMEPDLFEKIIQEIALRQSDVKQVMPYFMNEPLLDRDLINKIHYIARIAPDVRIHLVTNGILIDRQLGNKLINSPLHSIKISVLGHRKETYESAMGIKGHHAIFRRLCQFVRSSVRIRGPNWITISLTQTPGIIDRNETSSARRFWETMGVTFESFEKPISRAGNVNCVETRTHLNIKGCNSIWRNEMIHILYNGDVLLCCMDWRREVVLGNLYDQTISDIWNGQRNRYYQQVINGRQMEHRRFLCYRCEAANRYKPRLKWPWRTTRKG